MIYFQRQQELGKQQMQIESLIKIINDRQKQMTEQNKSLANLLHEKTKLLNSDKTGSMPMEVDEGDGNEGAELQFNDDGVEKLLQLNKDLAQQQQNLLAILNARKELQLQSLQLLSDISGKVDKLFLSKQSEALNLDFDVSMLEATVSSNASHYLPGFNAGLGLGLGRGTKRKESPKDSDVETMENCGSSKYARF